MESVMYARISNLCITLARTLVTFIKIQKNFERGFLKIKRNDKKILIVIFIELEVLHVYEHIQRATYKTVVHAVLLSSKI